MIEQLDAYLQGLGPVAFLVLGAAAFVEYVFPPFPGDSAVLLGGVYAARGQQHWFWVFVAVTVGSLLGAMLDYAVGRKLADRVDRDPRGKFLGISHQSLVGLHVRMERWGGWLLVFNRFMPGVRGLIFVAAGSARLPVGKVVALGTVAATLWNLCILAVGMAVGGNIHRLMAVWEQYQRAGWVLLGAVVVVLAGRWLFRRLRRKGTAQPLS